MCGMKKHKEPKVISLEEWYKQRRMRLAREFHALSDDLVNDEKEQSDE